MTTSIKTCFKCKVEKPLSEFYGHPKTKDGLLGKCKGCTKADVKENIARNPEKHKAYRALLDKRPHRRGLKAVRQRVYAGRNPEKTRAHTAISRAIKLGKLIRPDRCQNCGCGGRIHAHHPDYSKPLDVIWLCFLCHRAEHSEAA